MICENCGTEHEGSYGSGRFCSSKCARGFSTKANRDQISEKVSKALTGVKTNRKPGYAFTREDQRAGKRIQTEKQNALKLQQPFETWSKKFRYEHLFLKQDGKCSICSMEATWNGRPLTFHLDHVDGDRSNNKIENNRLLCPNCHSQTDTYCGKNKASFKSKAPAAGLEPAT